MYIVVVGLGQVGTAVVRALEAQGHEVVAIDRNAKAIAHAEAHFDVATLEGYGASARGLKTACTPSRPIATPSWPPMSAQSAP